MWTVGTGNCKAPKREQLCVEKDENTKHIARCSNMFNHKVWQKQTMLAQVSKWPNQGSNCGSLSGNRWHSDPPQQNAIKASYTAIWKIKCVPKMISYPCTSESNLSDCCVLSIKLPWENAPGSGKHAALKCSSKLQTAINGQNMVSKPEESTAGRTRKWKTWKKANVCSHDNWLSQPVHLVSSLAQSLTSLAHGCLWISSGRELAVENVWHPQPRHWHCSVGPFTAWLIPVAKGRTASKTKKQKRMSIVKYHNQKRIMKLWTWAQAAHASKKPLCSLMIWMNPERSHGHLSTPTEIEDLLLATCTKEEAESST